MDSHQVTPARTTVAEIRERLQELISCADAAPVLGVQEHAIYTSPRYRQLRRVRIGRKKFLYVAEVLALLADEPRKRRAAGHTILVP